MDNMIAATGAGVPFEYEGERYILPCFTLQDWGVLQRIVIAWKRKAITDIAANMKDSLSAEDWRAEMSQAKKEALGIVDVSIDEIETYLSTQDGFSSFLWVGLDRQYPGRFTSEDIQKMLIMKKFRPENVKQIFAAIHASMGLDPAGNSGSQGGQEKTEQRKKARRRNRKRSEGR